MTVNFFTACNPSRARPERGTLRAARRPDDRANASEGLADFRKTACLRARLIILALKQRLSLSRAQRAPREGVVLAPIRQNFASRSLASAGLRNRKTQRTGAKTELSANGATDRPIGNVGADVFRRERQFVAAVRTVLRCE